MAIPSVTTPLAENIAYDPVIANLSRQIAQAQADRIEMLAAAFLQATGLKPEECEVVTQFHPDHVSVFVRKRE